MRGRLICGLLIGLLAPLIFAEHWELQYFYDEDGKDLRLVDLAFPSATRGIAVGSILGGEGKKPQFTALVTRDGGHTVK